MSFSFLFNQDTCARVESAAAFPPVPASSVEVVSYERLAATGEDRLVFDLVDAPAPYANALRRALLSWVPSVALELVSFTTNTGIMTDEILAHRLGLVPLNVDPEFLAFPAGEVTERSSDPASVLLFGLHVVGGDGPEPDLRGVEAAWEGRLPPAYTGPSRMVTSSHLVWMPLPGQAARIPPAYPLHGEVPLTKLRRGQRIHLYARAAKGVGLDHAKFSPVCTAFYRLLPRVEVDPAITDAARRLAAAACPARVFEIEDAGGLAVRARRCTACRQCLVNPRVAGFLRVGKEAGRIEFTVESIGVRSAPRLAREALALLRERCRQVGQAVAHARAGRSDDRR
jgi:DNA-directed RNA polymerase I and III subunit RPAC1